MATGASLGMKCGNAADEQGRFFGMQCIYTREDSSARVGVGTAGHLDDAREIHALQ